MSTGNPPVKEAEVPTGRQEGPKSLHEWWERRCGADALLWQPLRRTAASRRHQEASGKISC